MGVVAISESLDDSEVVMVRDLLDRAFVGAFTDDDWLHAVGGHHVVVRRRGVIVAHASVVPRDVLLGTAHHVVGYVEAVATEPSAQGAGHGTAAMRAVDGIIRDRYRFGLLSTGAHHFYERLGWRRWPGSTWVRRTDGSVARTPDEDSGVMFLPVDGTPAVDSDSAITCDDRPGDAW